MPRRFTLLPAHTQAHYPGDGRPPGQSVHALQESDIDLQLIGLNALPERTGIGPYTTGMAEWLAADGHRVRLLTSFPHYPEWRFRDGAPPWAEREVVAGVNVRRVRHHLPRRGSSVSRVLSELSFGLRALFSRWGRPDAVVLVSPAMFSSALLVPRLLLTRTPFIVWVQDLYGQGVREIDAGDRFGVAATLIGRLESAMLRRADAVVVIGEHMAAAIRGCEVDADRIYVVRNWTHIDPPRLLDRAAVRADLGWKPGETIVLHSGNMGQKQDLKNVIEAAKLAARPDCAVRFVLMGDGGERPALEAAAAGVGRLTMLPSQSQEAYDRMLQAADVLLVNEQPGVRSMALPSKLTSYFAAGRPVLAATGRESATAAELRRSRAGERVDAGDPAALLDAVERLVADPDRMQELAKAGYDYRRSTLSEHGAGQRFTRVLRSLPARHGEPSVPQPAVTAPIELPTMAAQAARRRGGEVIGRTATQSRHRPAH